MKKKLICFAQCVLFSLALGASAWGGRPVDSILEWNAVALKANALDHTGPDLPGNELSDTQGPPASARVLAIVHVAMFDAYNSVDCRYTPYLTLVPKAEKASADAAVAKAAYDVLQELIPAGAEIYDKALLKTLKRVRSRKAKLKGLLVGTIVARRILELRSQDKQFLGGTYTSTGEPGDHDVDPKNIDQSFISPDIASLPPFGVEDITQFRAPQPPALDSLEYAVAFEEVKRLGEFRGGDSGQVVPTDDETYVIANYWSYNGSPLIGTPPRLYNQMARVVAKKQRNKTHENARLFALLNIAMADGGISAWDSKYTYRYWRPILGIQRADEDGNPLTEADPDWCALGGSRSNPLPGENNFSPPFPAYTSGHATFGAAAFKTLANFYQRDDISFVFVSQEWNGVTVDQFNRRRPLVPRYFKSLSYAAAENAASRVFNGVHWRFDGTEGVRAGNLIADVVFNTNLRPKRGGPMAIPDEDFEAQIDAILAAAGKQDQEDDQDEDDSDEDDSDEDDSDEDDGDED